MSAPKAVIEATKKMIEEGDVSLRSLEAKIEQVTQDLEVLRGTYTEAVGRRNEVARWIEAETGDDSFFFVCDPIALDGVSVSTEDEEEKKSFFDAMGDDDIPPPPDLLDLLFARFLDLYRVSGAHYFLTISQSGGSELRQSGISGLIREFANAQELRAWLKGGDE